MASSSHHSLAECRSYLKERLDDCFTRKDDLDPSKRFARSGITKEILDKQTLFHLFKLVIYQGHDGIGASDEDTLRSLAFQIRGSDTETFPGYCNILATLLYARCTDACLKSWAQSLLRQSLHDGQRRPIHDHDLPLTESVSRDNFGYDDGHSFWEQQSLFCPIILKEFDESIYVDHNQSCRLPFVEERTKIGKGNFAIVYKVKIEKGHLVNQSSGLALQKSKWYAQKEYIDYDAETKKAFEAEDSIIRKFIQAVKSHENILVTRASLEHGKTYSLFFDLAKYSLWDYFKDPTVSITTLEQKGGIFKRIIGLAGALAYLHDELFLASTAEQLCCYHLDLKPDNILVFEEGENVIWRVSDFGISQIKRIPASRANHESTHAISFLRIFRPDQSTADPSSGVKNPRNAGTYTAPEARHKDGKVTRSSDVWSLGCVLTLVLSFLENQKTGIEDFKAARRKDRADDLFYDLYPVYTGTESRPSLRFSVPVWLDYLTESAKIRSTLEGEAVGLASDLIQRQMLLPDPRDRASAKNVEQELKSIQFRFAVTPTPSQALHQRQYPKVERSNPIQSRIGWFRNAVSSYMSTPVKTSKTWHFQLPDYTRGSKFSHDGNYLGIESSQGITTLAISDILQKVAGVTHSAPTHERWSDFSLGREYLCAAVESQEFRCYFALLSSTDPSHKYPIDTAVKSRIRKIVVSPDDNVTAFILEESQQGGDLQKIGLYETKDMIRLLPTQSEPRSTRHGGSSTTGISEEMPWKNVIKNPADCEMPTKGRIHHLKFSDDGKILMAMTKPYYWEQTQEYCYDTFAWDVTNGCRILSHPNKTKGLYDMENSWRIRAIALFPKQPSFVAVSTKKIRIGSYKAGVYDSGSKATGDELLDVIVGDRDDELILIGRSNSIGRVKAFRLQKSQVDGIESVGKGIDAGVGGYDPMTDCCCLFREEGYGKQGIWIAKIRGRENEGRLSLCYLD